MCLDEVDWTSFYGSREYRWVGRGWDENCHLIAYECDAISGAVKEKSLRLDVIEVRNVYKRK